MQEDFLSLPAEDLLKRFAAGQHKPGSGSAAALMGLLSGALSHTVMALTSGRQGYDPEYLTEVTEGRVYEIEERLRTDFQTDVYVWDLVIRARRARDKAAEDGDKALAARLRRKALNHQRDATELPLEMGEMCVELAEMALLVFDFGFRSARGDSVVAITSATGAATGCLAIAYLNLKSFKRPGRWSKATYDRAIALELRISKMQDALTSRVRILHDDITDPSDGELT